MLILANGFFAAAEIAIVAARRGRLQKQADEGDRASRVALELGSNPNRFLSTVQVGITLISTFAAAFGGARLASFLTERLAEAPIPWVAANAPVVSLTIVVLAISFCSLILGELVPKRLALRRAESLARLVAPPMLFLSQVARPFVWGLGITTDSVLFLLGIPKQEDSAVSVEDIQHLLKMGREHGVLDPAEQKVAMEALRLGDRSVRDIMRPRTDLDALDVETPAGEIIGAVAMAGFSRLPVYERDLDHIIGYVHIKDLLREQYLHTEINLRKMLHPPLFVPETLPLDRLLDLFQKKRTQLAIVLDEFGGTQGMVTLEDVFEELVGEIHDEHRRDKEQEIVRRDDGSWLVDGSVSIDDLAEAVGLKQVESPATRRFSTVAGLVLRQLGRIPEIGARTTFDSVELEVVDMDGQRIDRVLVTIVGPTDATAG
ncbi:MAG TPA: hemolysin family protein [Pirellulales bacterium]